MLFLSKQTNKQTKKQKQKKLIEMVTWVGFPVNRLWDKELCTCLSSSILEKFTSRDKIEQGKSWSTMQLQVRPHLIACGALVLEWSFSCSKLKWMAEPYISWQQPVIDHEPSYRKDRAWGWSCPDFEGNPQWVQSCELVMVYILNCWMMATVAQTRERKWSMCIHYNSISTNQSLNGY